MFRHALALSAAFLLTACGGGGGSGPFAMHHEVDLPADAARSGYIYKISNTVVKADSGAMIRVGDTFADDWTTGFYSFAINGINPDATVTEAWLVVGQEMTAGQAYDDLGGMIMVDHVSLGAALSPADDIMGNNLTLDIGILSIDENQEQKVVDVTAAVQADLDANRVKSEFRLRFPIGFTSDGQSDWVRFNNPADNGGSGFVPRLIVKYAD